MWEEVVADGRRTAETKAAEDVDSSRDSPGRMWVCWRSPAEDKGDSRMRVRSRVAMKWWRGF